MKVKDLMAKLSDFDPKSDVKIVTRELRYSPDRIVKCSGYNIKGVTSDYEHIACGFVNDWVEIEAWVNFDHEYNIDDIIYGYYKEDQE